MSESVFVICQVGDDESPERDWADALFEYVIGPAVHERDMTAHRSDQDPTPGQVTAQIVRSLINARVVIADLTGQNANVYYELGIAQSFGIPVVILVDEAKSLAFDLKTERAITIGDSSKPLAAKAAAGARKKLGEALGVVLKPNYQPRSLISEVASTRSLDQLASKDPVAEELAHLRDGVGKLLGLVTAMAHADDEETGRIAAIHDMVSRLRPVESSGYGQGYGSYSPPPQGYGEGGYGSASGYGARPAAAPSKRNKDDDEVPF